MIAMGAMHSTLPISRRAALLGTVGRAGLALMGSAALVGCVARSAPEGPAIMPPEQDSDHFVMQDGARLPYRVWRPEGEVKAVALALHGFNDSRNAWEIPVPDYAAAGILLYAPDQRGFGGAPGRGLWPGTESLVDDAAEMAALLRARHPGQRLILMGESMGGAVLMCTETRRRPDVDGYVLIAPAVWGRAEMNIFLQAALWLAATVVPGVAVSRGPVKIRPSDNNDALMRLFEDPLTVRATRFDTLRGLVNLMDDALAAAPAFNAPSLVLYGAHDDLVPPAATAVLWRKLPAGPIRAFYPQGFHLLPRDLNRATVNADIAAYITTGARPAVAEAAAKTWLATQK
jgi:alpha-beta hydrolase superfamily lysophospholipase